MKLKIILLIWLILWSFFMIRDLIKREYLYDYMALIKRDKEGKRSYVYGDNYYEFLKFAKDTMPLKASYKLVGIEDISLAYRRGVYYMYPCIEKSNPDYILVYNYTRRGQVFQGGFSSQKHLSPHEYDLHAALDDERFVLKRR